MTYLTGPTRRPRLAWTTDACTLDPRLLLLSHAGSYIWLSFMLRESPRICDWLPEQQQVAFIFPVLLLWQDPVSLALFWLERPKPSVLFAADLMHAAGYQVLLLIWWLIMDGLRCYESMRDSWLRAMGGTQATGAVSLPPPWPPKHHPRGEVSRTYHTILWIDTCRLVADPHPHPTSVNCHAALPAWSVLPRLPAAQAGLLPPLLRRRPRHLQPQIPGGNNTSAIASLATSHSAANPITSPLSLLLLLSLSCS